MNHPWRCMLRVGMLISLVSPVSAQMNVPEITRDMLVSGRSGMQVIYSQPHAASALPYFAPLDDSDQEPALQPPVSIRAPIPFELRQRFPLTTPGMQSGRYPQDKTPSLSREQIPPLALCLIGSDQLSQTWLRLNRPLLVALRAQCLCVEAQRLEDWVALKQIAPDVPITPVAAVEFPRLGIRYYPVLIDQSGVKQ